MSNPAATPEQLEALTAKAREANRFATDAIPAHVSTVLIPTLDAARPDHLTVQPRSASLAADSGVTLQPTREQATRRKSDQDYAAGALRPKHGINATGSRRSRQPFERTKQTAADTAAETKKRKGAQQAAGDSQVSASSFGSLGGREMLDQLNSAAPVDLVFKTPLHAEMSQRTMESASMGPLVPGDLIFTAEHIDAIVSGNKKSDHSTKLFVGWNHFDGLRSFGEVQANWDKVQSAYQVIAGTDSKEKALESFGELLHATQDFYAHSNYVELFRDYFKERHGRLPESRECPLYEEGLKDPQFRQILERKLRTGGFTIVGFQKVKPVTDPLEARAETAEARSARERGWIFSDVGDRNPDLNSHSKIAKDNPGHELHGFASDLARRQTEEEIRKFKSALDDNPIIRWPRTPARVLSPPPVMQKGPFAILHGLGLG